MPSIFDIAPSERKQFLEDERKAAIQAQKDFIADLPAARIREAQAAAAEKAAAAAQVELQFRAEVRASYVQANGSDAGFDREWPALRAEIVRQRTLDHVGDVGRNGDLVDQWLARQAAMPQPTNPLLGGGR